MMELGATVCVPGLPDCPRCPVRSFCAAREAGTERELPVRLKKNAARDVGLDLALLAGRAGLSGKVFLVQRTPEERRLAGFWELPETKLFPKWRGQVSKRFLHRIVNDRFRITVWQGTAPKRLPAGKWFGAGDLAAIPLTTITRKAIASSE